MVISSQSQSQNKFQYINRLLLGGKNHIVDPHIGMWKEGRQDQLERKNKMEIRSTRKGLMLRRFILRKEGLDIVRKS